MNDGVYKVIEVIGTSAISWEDATKAAIQLAGETIADLRIAEVTELDVKIDSNEIVAYRAKLKLSFKYHKDYD